jgi:hypothetical protein
VTNVPGVVWESRIQNGHHARQAEFVSRYVEQMLGYSVEEWLATPGFFQSVVSEADREAVAREGEESSWPNDEVQWRQPCEAERKNDNAPTPFSFINARDEKSPHTPLRHAPAALAMPRRSLSQRRNRGRD